VAGDGQQKRSMKKNEKKKTSGWLEGVRLVQLGFRNLQKLRKIWKKSLRGKGGLRKKQREEGGQSPRRKKKEVQTRGGPRGKRTEKDILRVAIHRRKGDSNICTGARAVGGRKPLGGKTPEVGEGAKRGR